MNMLSAYIIEDELAGYENLANLLSKYCTQINLVGNAFNIQDSIEDIKRLKPDIVFLDIELPRENGFKLFDYFPANDFSVIFVTAYSEYAVKAFNYSALHYILKPIDIDELRSAVDKVSDTKAGQDRRQINVWKSVNEEKLNKIVLPTSNGLFFVELSDVIWCEAHSNYTQFYIQGMENILTSKSLKLYEDILSKKDFFRASRSSLININHIVHCSNHKRPEITMADGSIVMLSERRKGQFRQVMTNGFV